MSVKGFKLSDGTVEKYDYSSLEDIVTDTTLALSGVAADAKKVGDELSEIKEDLAELEGGGLSADLKAALDQLAQKVAYIDDDGQDYYDALHSALYPPATLSYITCVYTQSGTVYDTDSLNSLKSDLVVTAHYDNGTTGVVTNYTLSGTLTAGTSTITVSYSGKTTTFNVTVTHASGYVTAGLIHKYDGIDNTANGHDATSTTWKDLVGSLDITGTLGTTVSWGSDGIVFNGSQTETWKATANPNITDDCTVEVVVTIAQSQVAGIGSFGPDRSSPPGGDGMNLRLISIYTDNTIKGDGNSGYSYTNPENSITDVRTISVTYDDTPATTSLRVNNVEASLSSYTHSLTHGHNYIWIGAGLSVKSGSSFYPFKGTIHAIRIYNRTLTDAERTQNYNADVERFGV